MGERLLFPRNSPIVAWHEVHGLEFEHSKTFDVVGTVCPQGHAPKPKGLYDSARGFNPGNPQPLATRPEGAPEKRDPFLAILLFKTEAMDFVNVRSKTDARYILSTRFKSNRSGGCPSRAWRGLDRFSGLKPRVKTRG
jgi:hypothetical protein